MAMATTHDASFALRARRAATGRARRTARALRALTEFREGARYRATYGLKSMSADDIEAMWADPDCPVTKRRIGTV